MTAVDYEGMTSPLPFEVHQVRRGNKGTWVVYVRKSAVIEHLHRFAPGTQIEMLPVDGSGTRFGLLPEEIWPYTWKEITDRTTGEKRWEQVRGDIAYALCRITLPDGARFENIGIDADPQDAFTRAIKRTAALIGVAAYLDEVQIKASSETQAMREFAKFYAARFGPDGVPQELLQKQQRGRAAQRRKTPAKKPISTKTHQNAKKAAKTPPGKPQHDDSSELDIVRAIEWAESEHGVDLPTINAVLGTVGPLPNALKNDWATREWFASFVETLGKRIPVAWERLLTPEELKMLSEFADRTFPFDKSLRKMAMHEMASQFPDFWDTWDSGAERIGLEGGMLKLAERAVEAQIGASIDESDFIAIAVWKYLCALSQAFMAEIVNE